MGKPHCLRFVPWSLPCFCPWLDSSFFSFTNGGIASSSWNGINTITAIPEPSTYVAAIALLALMLWPLRRRLCGKVS
jgi:hypothetical protein